MLFGSLLAASLSIVVYAVLTFPRSAYARMLRALTATPTGAPNKLAAENSELGRKLQLIPLTRAMKPGQFLILQTIPVTVLFAALVINVFVTRHPPNWKVALIASPLVWLLPKFWLDAMVWQRTQGMTRGYSDLVAHLVLMLDAGASIQQAFSTAVAVTREPLRTELVQLVADLKLSPLPSALQRFAARTGHREIKFFAENLMLQQKIGIGLADALRDEERHTRILQQEEARQRIKAGAVTMAAVTAVLLANGLIVMALPVAGQWLSVMGGTWSP